MADEVIYQDGYRKVRRLKDHPGTTGGAPTRYSVRPSHEERVNESSGVLLPFQHDTIGKVGVVGLTNECLLAVVIDRLRGFQDLGRFPCRENALALTKIEEALLWLEKRTADRKARQVEGTHQA